MHVTAVIHVPEHGGFGPSFALTIAGGGKTAHLTLQNHTATINRVFKPGPNRLVIIGKLDGGGNVFSVIDTQANRLIDTVWSWEIAISPDGRYAAYEYRYPPMDLPMFRNPALLLYDFRLAPELIPRIAGDNARVGFILYPNANRQQSKYVLPEDAPDQRGFTSPIAWNSRSTQIAVVENSKATSLVVTDISKGWKPPQIAKWKIDLRLFYKPAFQDVLPDEYSHVTGLPVSKLRFVDDDQAVEITSIPGAGPFAERSVRVSLADGSATVVSQPSPPAEPHLKVPPEIHYVRVGGAVQEQKLLSKVEPAYPQGTPNSPGNKVVFEALIDRDGRVAQLLAIQGQPEMIKAAEQAVRQWTYMRTLLNGEPVAVLTTIILRAN